MTMCLLKSDLQRLYGFKGKDPASVTGLSVLFNAANPRFMPVVLCRLSHWCYVRNLKVIAKLFSLLNFHYFGIEMAVSCEIGPGLCFAHTFGIVAGARRIGVNALIYHEVTLGAKEMDMLYTPEKRPLIGDNVTIGAGAKVLGGITIGNNVIIGANAVVTRSVPDNVVVGGIPARVIRETLPTK